MQWRCPNDVFGYCKSKPEFENELCNSGGVLTIKGEPFTNTCTDNPKSCGKYMSNSDLCKKGRRKLNPK